MVVLNTEAFAIMSYLIFLDQLNLLSRNRQA
jgi:hypothetical protein